MNITKGEIDFETVIEDIKEYVKSDQDSLYEYIIGCDSQLFGKGVCYVESIVIHRIGKCGKYYYKKELISLDPKKLPLSQRIYTETYKSINLIQKLVENLHDVIREKDIALIHLDIGNNGKSKNLINTCLGMVSSYNIKCSIKPDSWASSTIADKHTKNVSKKSF
jgi:predicted RNase H-related nuclease YkuK (DUF458 family)